MKTETNSAAPEGCAPPPCSALVRRCDVCGIINACDLDATPARWMELQLPDHTVMKVTESEAMELWKNAGRCDHKKYIEELRAKIHAQNSNSTVIGTGFYREAKPGTFGSSEWLDLLTACQDGRATCMRALEIIEREIDLIRNPPKHVYWGAGEPGCPQDIKAPNGELHTRKCKMCGLENPRDNACRP